MSDKQKEQNKAQNGIETTDELALEELQQVSGGTDPTEFKSVKGPETASVELMLACATGKH